MKQANSERSAGDGHISHGFVSLSIEMLVPRIKGEGEKAPLMPFECLFRRAFVPNRGRSPATEYKYHLLVEMTLGLKALSRRYLTYIGVIGLLMPL
jgi:hypothetical protein